MELNIEAINRFRSNGNVFVIATGRDHFSIQKEIDEYNIPYDYLSCAAGSELLTKEQVLKIYPINKEAISILENKISIKVNYAKDRNEKEILECFYYIDNDEQLSAFKKEVVNYLIGFKELGVYKALFAPNKVLLVKPKIVSKAISGYEIARREQVSTDDIFTIGDEIVDLPMIEHFNGYAMKNATPSLKAKSLGEYNHVYHLISDIEKGVVKTKKGLR